MAPPPVTAQQLADLCASIQRTPIIDNHAHPLLRPWALSKYPLMSITTEASGDAIYSAWSSLAHIRATKQLAGVLGCRAASWESVVSRIEQARLENADAWTARCLHGIETILVDDGLDGADEVFDYAWHDAFTRSPCKRIVRLEKVAADLIDEVCQLGKRAQGGGDDACEEDVDAAFGAFLIKYANAIKGSIEDEEVVGFKSVICYRTGLNITRKPEVKLARTSFSEIYLNYGKAAVEAEEAEGEDDDDAEEKAAVPAEPAGFKRLQHPGLNDLIVHIAAQLIRDCEARRKKPVQFHTGLGDNDLTMTRASPSHLQDFIREYPTVPIVLLHASYPFTREAGYLASVYTNVYADIGEVFPFLSKDGQEGVVRQILELCPWSKILWSTDGHWFPETYLLAVIQIREVLEKILCEYVKKGHIGWKAAKQLARDILFSNSNNLYDLHIPYNDVYPASSDFLDTPDGATPAEEDEISDLTLFQSFLSRAVPGSISEPDPAQFVRISWVDLTASHRCRLVPVRRVLGILESSGSDEAGPDAEDETQRRARLHPFSIGVTKACMGLLQNDTIAPGWSPTGEYRLFPDFASLRRGVGPTQLSVFGEFREQDGSEAALCPRTLLRRTLQRAAAGPAGLQFKVGFEIEFVLISRGGADEMLQLSSTLSHAWSLARALHDSRIAAFLSALESSLATQCDPPVLIEQLHSEAGPGQYELVLPPQPPLQAVDTLLFVRECLASLAAQHGYRATLHPKPDPMACGTASHMHISLAEADDPDAAMVTARDRYEPFYAGVLAHLRAVAAFAYSAPASYERVVDGAWAGGRWVAWGTQNRETALRKVDASHWEVKCLDGLANPYLAVAAIVGAGCVGGVLGGAAVGENGKPKPAELTWGDCEIDPAQLTENDRFELGVKEMLPLSLPEALEALKADGLMATVMGEELVERYCAVKEAEMKFLEGLGKEKSRELLLERY